MNVKKIITLLLAALLVLSLAACGTNRADDDMTTAADGEPKNAQEAAAMYKDLMDQENAILMENRVPLGEGVPVRRQGHDHAGGRQELR